MIDWTSFLPTTGDFDRDGRLDLAAAANGTSASTVTVTVSVFLGNGDGNFQNTNPAAYAVGGAVNFITTSDFNGDGILDLTTANEFGASVSVLLGTDNGLFAAAEQYSVGRGAAFVLPPQRTLRVRLIAPRSDRIANLVMERGLAPDQAEKLLERTDAERSAFIQEHFRKDPADPCHYDLVLNTARLAVDECSDLIVEALRQVRQCEAKNNLARRHSGPPAG